MGYTEFAFKGKSLVTGDQIGSGQIGLHHFAPGLFAEFRQISQHTHSGVKTKRIQFKDLEGSIGKDGFLLYSNDGTKLYRIQVNNSGTLTATQVT